MNYKRKSWTFEQLDEIIPKLLPSLSEKLDEIEGQENEEVNPLPMMSINECTEYFHRLLDIAYSRKLTGRETFIFGQLLAQYKAAVMADVLGRKGRYFVIDENDIPELIEKHAN